MYILFLLVLFHSLICEEIETISIDPTTSSHAVNRKILGTNTVGGSECYYNRDVLDACMAEGSNATSFTTDYAAGQWNVSLDAPNPYLKEVLISGGFSSLRYPGGCNTHYWNWKDGIEVDRTEFQFGINEFLALCEDLDVIPVITLSYFASSNDELLELFRYLKLPSGIGDYWADKRANDYRTDPYDYNIYFEFGNEVYHGDHITLPVKMGSVQPSEYAERFNELYTEAKLIDSSIQLGIIIEELETFFFEWNSKVLDILVEDNYDFVITHVYPFSIEEDPFDDPPPEEFFPHAFACDHQAFESLKELYKIVGGKKIAITEFNSGIVQPSFDLPIPWRHSFGNAMQVADLVLLFLKLPEEVLLAQFWQFSNLYWGSVYTEDNFGSGTEVFKRPNYWIYPIFDHFLYDEMIDVEIPDVLRYHVDFSSELSSKGWIKYDYDTVINSPEEYVPISDTILEVNFELFSASGVESYDLGEGMYMVNFSSVSEENLDFAMISDVIPVKYPVRYVLTGWLREEDFSNGTICVWVLEEPLNFDWYYFNWKGCLLGSTTETDDGYIRFEYQFMPPETIDEVRVYFLRGGDNMQDLIHGKVFIGNVKIEERLPFTDPPKLNMFASKKSGNENEVGLVVFNRNVEESIQVEISEITGWEDGFEIEETWSLEEELDFVDENGEQNLEINKELRTGDIVLPPHTLMGLKLTKKVVCDESNGFEKVGYECICREGFVPDGERCVEEEDDDDTSDDDVEEDSSVKTILGGLWFMLFLN